MYSALFRTIFEVGIANGENAFTHFYDFLGQVKTSPDIISELIKEIPLFSMMTQNVWDELLRTYRCDILDYLKSDCKILSLSIPTFEYTLEEREWIQTTKVRRVEPRMINQSTITFECDISSAELYNHSLLGYNYKQEFLKTAFFHRDVPTVLRRKTNVDSCLFFSSLDLLDYRCCDDNDPFTRNVLRCYLSSAVQVNPFISKSYGDIKLDVKDSKTIFTCTLQFDIREIADYFSRLMIIYDIKKAYHILKLESVERIEHLATSDTYFRNIWYDRGSDNHMDTLRDLFNGEFSFKGPLCETKFNVFKGDNGRGRLNISSDISLNIDLCGYLKLTSSPDRIESQNSDADRRIIRKDLKKCYANENDDISIVIEDDGYITNFDTEACGDYGWFSTSLSSEPNRHFPEPLRLNLILTRDCGESNRYSSDILTCHTDVKIQRLNQQLSIDFKRGCLDYEKFRFDNTLGGDISHQNVCYELGLIPDASPTDIIDRVEMMRSTIQPRQNTNLTQLPYDVRCSDIENENEESKNISRCSSKILVVRNLNIFREKEKSMQKRAIYVKKVREILGFGETESRMALRFMKGSYYQICDKLSNGCFDAIVEPMCDIVSICKSLHAERFSDMELDFDDDDEFLDDLLMQGQFGMGYSNSCGELLYVCSDIGSTILSMEKFDRFSKYCKASAMFFKLQQIMFYNKDKQTKKTITFMLQNIVDIYQKYLKRELGICAIAGYVDEEYPKCIHSRDMVYSNSCYSAAQNLTGEDFVGIKMRKYPKCFTYDINMKTQSLSHRKSICVSVPRYNSEKSYVGCCGHLSSAKYQFYRTQYSNIGLVNNFIHERYKNYAERLKSEFESGRRLHNHLCDKLDTDAKSGSESKSSIGRIIHRIQNGGVKYSFSKNITTFKAKSHRGYISSVDFGDDLMYSTINNFMGICKTLTGRSNRCTLHLQKKSKSDKQVFLDELEKIDLRISRARIEWRRDFCDIKTKIISQLKRSGIHIDVSVLDVLNTIERTGSKCYILKEVDEFGREIPILKKVETKPSVRTEYPIDVSNDWCFSPKAYNYVNEVFSNKIGQKNDLNSEDCPNESGIVYQYPIRHSEDRIYVDDGTAFWHNLDKSILDDEQIFEPVYYLGMRPKVLAPYLNVQRSRNSDESFRLSLNDDQYCIIEDHVFEKFRTRSDNDPTAHNITQIAIEFSGILHERIKNNFWLSSLEYLSTYNAIKSLLHNWTHSFMFEEISTIVKYERLLEGVLNYSISPGKECVLYRFIDPHKIERPIRKIRRFFKLDFMLWLQKIAGDLNIVSKNRISGSSSSTGGVSYGSGPLDRYYQRYLHSINVFANSWTNRRYSPRPNHREDHYLNGFSFRSNCECLDCSIKCREMVSDFGGYYRCFTISDSMVNPTISEYIPKNIKEFEYTFGVRHDYAVYLNSKNKTVIPRSYSVDLYDDRESRFEVPFHIEDYDYDNNIYPEKRFGDIEIDHIHNMNAVHEANWVSLHFESSHILQHAIQCCENMTQKKIHERIMKNNSVNNRDDRTNCVKLIISVYNSSESLNDDENPDEKVFKMVDYIHLFDLEQYDVLEFSDIKDKSNDIWSYLNSAESGIPERVLYDMFGYIENNNVSNMVKLQMLTSRAWTFASELPIMMDYFDNHSTHRVDMKCELIKKSDMGPSVRYASRVEYSKTLLHVNNINVEGLVWTNIPLFMIIYRTYLNLSSTFDKLFDPKFSILFNDAKYTLLIKLKLATFICFKIINIAPFGKTSNCNKEKKFKNPFETVPNMSDSRTKFSSKMSVETVDCRDILSSDASTVLDEVADYTLGFYEKFSRLTREDVRPSKKQKINSVEPHGLWDSDFSNRKYTERELGNVLYSLAMVNYASVFERCETFKLHHIFDDRGVGSLIKDPKMFLSVPFNVLWYDQAKMFCEGKIVEETEDFANIVTDMNEFI